jgi:hypothetical protein
MRLRLPKSRFTATDPPHGDTETTMHGCIVRRAMLEDAVAICDRHKASVRGLCAGAYSIEQIEAWLAPRVPDDYRKAMTVGGETMCVGQRDQRIVGFASIRTSRLIGLYVDL